MNTREIAAEYRMAHWAQIIQERKVSGENIRDYCRRTGYTEHTYYYWQQKLRKAAYEKQIQTKEIQHGLAVPDGWTQCVDKAATPRLKTVTIEIGGCKVITEPDVEAEHLKRICQVLLSIC